MFSFSKRRFTLFHKNEEEEEEDKEEKEDFSCVSSAYHEQNEGLVSCFHVSEINKQTIHVRH